MRNIIKSGLLLAALTLAVFVSKVQGQSQTKEPSYKEMVGDNPNAEADIKVVSDYVNALTSGDLDKAKSLLAENYKGYGPGPTDSATVEQTLKAWSENYKIQSNRKVSFVPETFEVKSGDLKGEWVAIWGDYSFTQDGKNVSFPVQYTAHVTGGKIDTDRVYYDRLYIVQTLGYKVTAPGDGK